MASSDLVRPPHYPDRLCSECKRVLQLLPQLLNNQNTFLHYSDFNGALWSAEQGCHLCARFTLPWHNLKKQEKVNLCSAVYGWQNLNHGNDPDYSPGWFCGISLGAYPKDVMAFDANGVDLSNSEWVFGLRFYILSDISKAKG